jgi:hypothetical protein
VTGDWRKLHNEELHNLYSSPNIIRVNKSRRMRWAGHVVHMGYIYIYIYIYIYTGCNRIKLKIYCVQTNSNITIQFLTEHLLPLQILLQVFSMAATGYAADIHTIF